MKRSVRFLAFMALLILGGVGAWQLWLRETPETALDLKAPSILHTNVVPNPEVILDPALEESFASPNVRPQGQARRMEEVVGIGAIIRSDRNTDELMISGSVPNSPAAAAGLSGNFVIRKIDDVSTAGMKLQECVGLIRGAVGTKVRLELFNVDANEAMTIELTRQKLQL